MRPQRLEKSPTAEIDLLPTSVVDILEKPKLSPFLLVVSDWCAGAALNTHWLRAMGERQWCRVAGAVGAAQARTRYREWIPDRCDA